MRRIFEFTNLQNYQIFEPLARQSQSSNPQISFSLVNRNSKIVNNFVSLRHYGIV